MVKSLHHAWRAACVHGGHESHDLFVVTESATTVDHLSKEANERTAPTMNGDGANYRKTKSPFFFLPFSHFTLGSKPLGCAASEELLRASNLASGGRLRRILSLAVQTEDFSTTTSTQLIITSVLQMIDDLLIEGIEINWLRPSTDENSKKDKADLVLFMKVGWPPD